MMKSLFMIVWSLPFFAGEPSWIMDLDSRPKDTALSGMAAAAENLFFSDDKQGIWSYGLGDEQPRLLAEASGIVFAALAGGVFLNTGFANDELWFYNLEEGRSTLVSAQGNPKRLLQTPHRIYFSETDFENGLHYRLWGSDGNRRFEIGLFRDINQVVEYAGSVWFQAENGVRDEMIWRYELDSGELHEVMTSSLGVSLALREDGLYLTAYEGTSSSLWFVDGGGEATVISRLEGFYHGRMRILGDPQNSDQPLLFHAVSGDQNGLWRSDGTAAGTLFWFSLDEDETVFELGDRNPADLSQLLITNHALGSSGRPQWRVYTLQPQASGGHLIADFPLGQLPEFFASTEAGHWFLVSPDTRGLGFSSSPVLWFTDGVAHRARPLLQSADPNGFLSLTKVAALNGTLLFLHRDGRRGWRLFSSGGRVENTGPVASDQTITRGPENFRPLFANIENRVYFWGGTDAQGNALMASDGNRQWPVGDLSPGERDLISEVFGSPEILGVLGDRLVFSAGRAETGLEPWVLDPMGQPAILEDRFAGAGSSGPSGFLAHGDSLYWRGREVLGNGSFWRWDGQGPIRSLDRPGGSSLDPRHLFSHEGLLYFFGYDRCSGFELYRSDGTREGTAMVANLAGDFNDGASCLAESSLPQGFQSLGRSLLFMTASFDAGWYRWRPEAGELNSLYQQSSFIPGTVFVGVDQKAYFLNPNRRGIWSLAAEETEMRLEADLPSEDWSRDEVTHFGKIQAGFLLFRQTYRRSVSAFAHELWLASESGGQAQLLMEVVPEPGFSNPEVPLSEGGKRLAFILEDPQWGREWFVTDGTVQGTGLLRDLYPGPVGSAPRVIDTIQGWLYFSAETPEHGRELWRLHPEELVLERVADLEEGPSSSDPVEVALVGNRLYVVAKHGATGYGLYGLDLDAAAAGPDRAPCGTTLNLEAQLPANAVGRWSILAGEGGIIDDPSDPNSLFQGQAGTDYLLNWSVLFADDKRSQDRVFIRFREAGRTPMAGEDLTLCPIRSVQLNAEPVDRGYARWELAQGQGSFSSVYDPDALFYPHGLDPDSQTYRLRWVQRLGECEPEFAEVELTPLVDPAQFAGPVQTLCGNEAMLHGAAPWEGARGRWRLISGEGGSLSDESDPRAVLSGRTGQTYRLEWSIESEECGQTLSQTSVSFVTFEGSIHGPSTARFGQNTRFRAPEGLVSYLWFNGETGREINLTASESLDLWVDVVTPLGCTHRLSHRLNVTQRRGVIRQPNGRSREP